MAIAPRNRTLKLSSKEIFSLRERLIKLGKPVCTGIIQNRIINQDLFEVLPHLPSLFVDLLIVDPPYNLNKTFGESSFRKMGGLEYEDWLDSWLSKMVRILKPSASVYLCGDWRSSAAIYNVAGRYFKIRNRITWEREKGRGAKGNWKNNSEDIWFCTFSDDYYFNLDAVKLKRRVLAPYKDKNGLPKDWTAERGGRYRITHPSNIWTDITVPFWSMSENTDHPTQKPEKLIAKIILASSKPGDMILDPFLGCGTTAVVASKLGREYVGVEIDEYYSCLAIKRLDLAKKEKNIQGFSNGVFLERNSK